MHSKFSLRTRFSAVLLLLVSFLAAGFGFAIYRFVEVLEAELIDDVARRELRQFVEVYQRAPDLPPPHAVGLQAYVVRPGIPAPIDLPAQVLDLARGVYNELEINGKDLYVGREDVGEAHLFVVLDVGRVEALEARLVRLGSLFVLGALVIAVLVGWLLARVVMRPVSGLARQVAELSPGSGDVRLREDFGDREIGLIASAFDRYQDRLAEVIQRERAFTDDASHELRTPVAIVLSAAQLLQEEPGLSARARERVARVTRAGQQMQQLIEALLFLAREDGSWSAEPCVLEEVLRQVAEHHSEALNGKPLALHCDIVQASTVMAPPGMALCVINNLVEDALQHTERGRIDLRLEADRVVIQDTGTGIVAADLPHLFERHYRGARSRGLGLGLYIVKRICERLNWRVEAQSAPGAGARFDVIFSSAT